MFVGDELSGFVAIMDAHLAAAESGVAQDAALLVAVDDDDQRALGAVYFKPEMMTQGVMNLLFIGVAAKARQKGVGRALVARFDEAAQASRARLAIIETASAPMFAPAWRLYQSAGYVQEARLRDYYDNGLDKLIFWKRF